MSVRVSYPGNHEICVGPSWHHRGQEEHLNPFRLPGVSDRMSWTYEQWNDFLSSRLFTLDKADALVYLLLDEDDLDDAAATMGVEPEEVLPDLARAVRSKMRLNGAHDGLFGWFASHIHFWTLDVNRAAKEAELPIPPVIGFLALCSEAAKEMGSSGMSPNHFYGPLAELLNLDSNDRSVLGRLADSYRAVVEASWDCVRRWCTENEGQRGLVSATSTTAFPYVGLAVSQALVREHDRRHLPDFFRQYRLSPTLVTESEEVESALTEWLASPSSSASRNFRSIWNNKSARPRALEIVMRELDQMSVMSVVGRSPRLTLEASLSMFPRVAITWSMIVENTESEESVPATLTINDQDFEVVLQPTLDAELYVDLRSVLADSTTNVIFSSAKLTLANGTSVSRTPRRLVLLAKNTLTGRFEETLRAPLGEACIVVVSSAIDAEAVRRLARNHAEAGWREIALATDVAESGVAFANVRIGTKGFQASSEWLQPMVPRESSALTVEGGLALGRQAWLLNRPPLIRATVAGGDPFELKLLRINEDQSATDVSAIGLALSKSGANIVGDSLEPGRYRVDLRSCRSGDLLRSANLRLVTSDTVDVRSWRRSSRLARDFTSQGAMAAVTAAPPSDDPGILVEGALVSSLSVSPPVHAAAATLQAWWTSEAEVERQIARRTDESDVSPVDWADAVEGLMYLGGGSTSGLTSIARQVMPSEEFAAWRFWRAYSDLAHIEVALDRVLMPRTWRLVRPQLAGTVSGQWLLCGYWPRKAVERFNDALPIPLTRSVAHHGPESVLTEILPASTVERARERAGIDATLIPNAASRLAQVLPSIADLASSLPSTHIPDFDVIARFDVATRRYERVDRISQIGAYKGSTRGMQRTLVVTPDSLPERRCHFADSDLAKHIAAGLEARPFIAYHPGKEYLVTPFGVRLPHLYGRVATLCSGRLSRTHHNSWTVYEGVPAEVAQVLHTLMQWKETK